MTIWKEEIFGPVLSVIFFGLSLNISSLKKVMTFKTEEEAIQLANNTTYGLAAAVMTKNQERSERIVKRLKCGIAWINCSQPCFCHAPWGGVKKSGIGRELGKWGLENYLSVKQITSYEIKEPGKWGWYIKSKI